MECYKSDFRWSDHSHRYYTACQMIWRVVEQANPCTITVLLILGEYGCWTWTSWDALASLVFVCYQRSTDVRTTYLTIGPSVKLERPAHTNWYEAEPCLFFSHITRMFPTSLEILLLHYISPSGHTMFADIQKQNERGSIVVTIMEFWYDHGALVRSWTPCHFLMSSPKISFTSRCCLMTARPLNFSDVIDTAYMLPQPPLTSLT